MMDIDTPGIEYFTSNPKGHLLERHVRNNFPEFYKELMKYPNDLKFPERVYWYFNNLHEKPICPICGKHHLKFKTFTEGYFQNCSLKCSNQSQERLEKIKATTLERYGVENASQSQEIKEKKKQTSRENYGVDHPLQSQEIKEKVKQTTLERYGVENASQSQEIKEKKKQTSRENYGVDHPLQSQEIKEKVKQTTLERYGVENASQSQEIKEKVKQTTLERYGVENTFQSQELMNKARKTCLEKYGAEFASQSSKIKEKYKDTCRKKYGFENTFLIPEIKEKARQSILLKTKNRNNEIIDINIINDTIIYTCKCINPKCKECKEKQFQIPSYIFNNRRYHKTELCTHLLPLDNHHNSGTSLELFIRSILDDHKINYETNNRTILDGKELDLYLPDHKLAIECNGVYWHSLKEPKYHFNKWKQCKEQDIQLLTIWEDQIINKPEIIKNIVLSKLGIYEHKVGARECTIKETSNSEAQEFLSMYHLQGSVAGSVRLGLYHNDELVSLMVFGRKRTSLGNKKHDTWELYRYCTKAGWSIMGGAQKLLSHFCNDHMGTILESFSSNDISIGTLYKKLGFELESIQSGSYWYIDREMNRHHRYTFRKDVLVREGYDPNLTEFEITDGIGLFRIYDSGQQKWILQTP